MCLFSYLGIEFDDTNNGFKEWFREYEEEWLKETCREGKDQPLFH
mgnify:CR=1 FL=1